MAKRKQNEMIKNNILLGRGQICLSVCGNAFRGCSTRERERDREGENKEKTRLGKI
jgi:hypothetical protein